MYVNDWYIVSAACLLRVITSAAFAALVASAVFAAFVGSRAPQFSSNCRVCRAVEQRTAFRGYLERRSFVSHLFAIGLESHVNCHVIKSCWSIGGM